MNFQIELTNYCNLKCVECPNHLMKRKRELMSSEVFGKVIEYIKEEQPNAVILHKDGEPLLHSSLNSFIYQIGEVSNACIEIYTNGILFDKYDIESMVNSVKNKIRFLVSFHFYNMDGSKNNYELVTKNLLEIINLLVSNLEVILTTHVTDFVDEEKLNEWKEFWESKRTKVMKDIHVNKNINPWTGLIKQKNNIKFDSCPYADFGHLFIGVTGNAIPCCMDLEEKLSVGNIMTENKEVLFSRIKEHYKTLSDESTMNDLCKKCMGL